MSDTPTPDTPASAIPVTRRFHVPVEPVLIGIGLLVLLMVGYWLLVTPRSIQAAPSGSCGTEALRISTCSTSGSGSPMTTLFLMTAQAPVWPPMKV